jgi:hypothetical protein
MVETLQLANIHAGKGLTVDATGGIVVDIPVVPATPAPEPQVDAQGNIIPAVPLTPEQQATQQQTALDNHIQTLAGKPGQEWIGQLAQMAKEKPDAVKLQQVNAAAQHWDYAHEGLTSEAAAVIVIVVTYFTAGAGSSAVGTSTAVGGTTTTTLGGATLATTTAAGTSYTALGAAINAGFSTLASQAAVSIINNQGDIGQTLNDLGKSENVKATIAAMLSAGIGQGLANTQYMGGVHTSANTALSTSSLLAKLELNLINTTVNTAVNSAVYGTSFTNALGTNLQNAGIDTLAAVTANVIGQSYKGPDGYLNGQPVLHDLAHAALGCASAAARRQDCASGALGGLVGEVSAELIGGTADGSQLTPEQQGQVVFLSQLATAGAAITTGSNLSTALGTSQNAVVNNYLTAAQVQQKLDKLAKAKTDEDKKKIDQEFDAISQANNDAGFHDLNNHDSMAGFQLAQDQAGLTTLLTGPTTCANDSACRMAVNNNLNELQGVVDGHNAIEGFFNVIPAVQMAVLPVSVVGEAAASLFGAGRVTATSSSTALSTYRYTQDGETFFHYGYAQQAGNFAGGLRPGGYATNIGGLTGSEAQAGLALPHATAPDAVYVVSPQPGTLVRVNPVADAKFGQSGGLPEFQFPAGTHSGTVSQPRALP